MAVYYQTFDLNIGKLTGVCDDKHLLMLSWDFDKNKGNQICKRLGLNGHTWRHENHSLLEKTYLELSGYLHRTLKGFDIPIRLEGTCFQHDVWHELQHVPYGTTTSYGKLAKDIGKPNAFRAVANANGANALPIIVPCHRVISSDGTLGGYTGGTHIKQYLLELEGVKLKAHL